MMGSGYQKKLIAFVLMFAISVSTLSGCLIKDAYRDNAYTSVKKPTTEVGYGKVKLRPRKEIDYSTERFEISGNNAFYILPGLENIPDAMATFKVLDYNSRGEFVYFYVTPSYLSPEQVKEYQMDPRKSRGFVPTTGFTKINRPDNYKYDAVVLMAYNPDTGFYHVMFADSYEIEFDPKTEGRPYYYEMKLAGAKNQSAIAKEIKEHFFIQERGIASKVPEREEYFLLNESAIGTVYNAAGEAVASLSLMDQIDDRRLALEQIFRKNPNEGRNAETELTREEKEERDFEEWKKRNGLQDEKEEPKTGVSAIITDAAMGTNYETYVSITYFTLDEPLNPKSQVRMMTLLSFRQPLNKQEEAVPFRSVNLAAKDILDKWMSIDRHFFNSRKEMENNENYYINELRVKYDNFTPFISGTDEEQSIIVGSLNFYNQRVGSFTANDVREIIDAYTVSEYDKKWLNWYAVEYENEKEKDEEPFYKITNWFGITEPATEKFHDYWNYNASLGGKRAIRAIQALILGRNIRGFLKAANFESLIKKMKSVNLVPSMGNLEKKSQETITVEDRYKGKYGPGGTGDKNGKLEENLKTWTMSNQRKTKIALTPVFNYDNPFYVGRDGRYESLHVLRVLSSNDVYSPFVSPVDYYKVNLPANANARSTGIKDWTLAEAEVYLPETERTCYYKNEEEADQQLNKYMEIRRGGSLTEDHLNLIKGYLRGGYKDLLKENAESIEKAAKTLVNSNLKKIYDRIREQLEEVTPDEDGEFNAEKLNQLMEDIDRMRRRTSESKDSDGEEVEEIVELRKLLDEVVNESVKQQIKSMTDIRDAIDAIPEGDRDLVLVLCGGFVPEKCLIEKDKVPTTFQLVFPGGSGATIKEAGNRETIAGSLFGTKEGVLVIADSNVNKGAADLVGYQKDGNMFVYDTTTFGKSNDAAEIRYRSTINKKNDRDMVVVRTDAGVRFLVNSSLNVESVIRGGFTEDERYVHGVMKNYLSKVDSNYAKYLNSWSYVPLRFPSETVAETEKLLKEEQKKDSTKAKLDLSFSKQGFITLRQLMTSGGYTRDTENKTSDAVKEELERIEEEQSAKNKQSTQNNSSNRENRYSADREPLPTEGGIQVNVDPGISNERFTGRLTEASNFTLISPDTVVCCTVEGGTKILNLKNAKVTDDMEGSYYRLFQRIYPNDRRTDTYKLIGFQNAEYGYKDADIAMAKIYTRKYSSNEVDETLVSDFMQNLNQMAKDYVHREYRTSLDKNNELQNIKLTADEKKEEKKAEALFSGNEGTALRQLQLLEKEYGINSNPQSVQKYLKELRTRVLAVKPAIAAIYKLAGGSAMVTNKNGLRQQPYWKNLEARMTLALEQDDLEDIMVEIRMHDEVLPTLVSANQAKKYRDYKELLDFTANQGKVSADEIFGAKEGTDIAATASANSSKLSEEYRADVINDIKQDYFNLKFPNEMNKVLQSTAISAQKANNGTNEPAKSDQTGETPMELEARLSKAYDQYVRSLITQVNPDSFVQTKDDFANAFVDNINHGAAIWAEPILTRERDAIKESLAKMDSVWGLEELIIREKIRSLPPYQKYASWWEDYQKRSEAGSLMERTGTSRNGISDANPLSGTERVSFLRQSEAYKTIIGDIKGTDAVKEYLKNREETWDDYLKEVILVSGSGAVRNDRGEVEEGYEDQISRQMEQQFKEKYSISENVISG